MTKKELALIEHRLFLASVRPEWNLEVCRQMQLDAAILVEEVKRLREVLYGELKDDVVNHI